MADFNTFFAEFLKEKTDPDDNAPLYVTNVQFSECISTFEMKIYQGEPLAGVTSDDFKNKLRETVVDDIVLNRAG